MTEKNPLYGSQNATYSQTVWSDTIGKRNYELTNHLNNVLSVISDKVIPHSNGSGGVDYFLADIRQSTDYSAFGVQLEGRNLPKFKPGTTTPIPNADGRYGFNGMEEDDQIKGEGNSYDFGARMLDPRLGRWLTIDPMFYKNPNLSPYNFCENNPLYLKDPDGNDAIITIVGNTITVTAKVYIMNDGDKKIDVAKAQKAIMKYWDKKFTYTDENGKKYNVKFDIQVKEADGNEDPNDASKNWVRPMDENFRSNVSQGRYGKWAINQDNKTYAHEMGHFLGLGDQYVDSELDPELNYWGLSGDLKGEDIGDPEKDELMATAKGYEGKERVTQKDINAIAKYALSRQKKGQVKNGKIILDAGRIGKDGHVHGLAGPTDKQMFKKELELNKQGRKIKTNPDNNAK